MNKNCARLITVALLAIVCFSACKHKPEDVITQANKTREDINKNLGEYKSKHVDDLTSAAPASITGYYREEELKKIYAEYFGEKDRTFTEFYFDDGMLVCVLEQDYIYNKPNTYTEEKAKQNNDTVWYDDKKTKLETSVFYFTGTNKMIKWTDAGNDIPMGSTDFTNRESEIWAQAAVMIKELKEQDR